MKRKEETIEDCKRRSEERRKAVREAIEDDKWSRGIKLNLFPKGINGKRTPGIVM